MRYLPLLLAALLPLPAQADDAPLSAGEAAGTAAPTAEAGTRAEALPPEGAVVEGAVAEGPDLAGAAAAPVEPPPSWVYLVARVKLKDTDLTQVAFLRHPEVATLEACEAERAAGLTTGWRHFNRYYFRTLKGISYQIDFRCVEGTQYLAPWRRGEPLGRHYLVRTKDATLQVEEAETFFACRRALRQATREEGIDAFCATASQAILPPPAREAEEAETAPPAADAPASSAPRAPAR